MQSGLLCLCCCDAAIFSLRQTIERNEIRIDSYPEDYLSVEPDPPSGNSENSKTKDNAISTIHGKPDVMTEDEDQIGALILPNPLSFDIQGADENILQTWASQADRLSILTKCVN